MTNKELEVIVCNAIDTRKEQGTPFDRDAFAALVKMAQALYPHTTYEHQIDVVARMKSIVDPIDGFHPRWETNELFDACIKAIEAKQPSYTEPSKNQVSYKNCVILKRCNAFGSGERLRSFSMNRQGNLGSCLKRHFPKPAAAPLP